MTFLKEIMKMIGNMDTGFINGLMEHNIKDNTKMAKKRDKELLNMVEMV